MIRKIMYVTLLGQSVPGVQRKIQSQVEALRCHGNTVYNATYILSGSVSRTTESDDLTECLSVYEVKKSIPTILGKMRNRSNAFLDISELVARCSPDVIFFRYPLSDFSLYKFVRRHPGAVFFEHQTKEIEELCSLGPVGYVRAFLEILFSGLVMKHAAGGVAVTDELSEYEMKRHSGYRVHTISNGINVNGFNARSLPCYDGVNVHLLIVANMTHWHGTDRLLAGLLRYNGAKRFHLHFVGVGKELQRMKTMAEGDVAAGSVRYYGSLFGSDLDDLFDMCHVAVGSLGMHRVGLSESSSLKNREYITRGMPFVSSSIDTDIVHHPSIADYVLKLESDDSAIDYDKIGGFVDAVMGRPAHPLEMREYAHQVLDMSVKMGELKMLFDSR